MAQTDVFEKDLYTPEGEYHVVVLAGGKLHRLCVKQVPGETGDFTVLDENREIVGSMYMKRFAQQLVTNNESAWPLVNFNECKLWEAKGDLVKTYLNQITGQIALQVQKSNQKPNAHKE